MSSSTIYPNAQPPFPDGNFVFLTIGWEGSFPEEKLARLKLDQKWHIDKESWIITQLQPLSEYLSEPERFAEKLVSWAVTSKSDIEAIACTSQVAKVLPKGAGTKKA